MSLPRRHTVQHCGDPVAASVTCHPFTDRWPPTTSRHRPSKLSHKAEGSWPGVCRAGARRHPRHQDLAARELAAQGPLCPPPRAWGWGCHPEGGSPSCGQAPGVPPRTCQDPKLPEVLGRLLCRWGLRAWGWQPAGAAEAAEYFPWRAGGRLAHGHTWCFPSPTVS